MVTKKKRIQGRKSRASGARFELKVRNELEKMGWIIDRWTNNVDLEQKKLVKAKRKFNPYLKILGIGAGFPDFIGIKRKKNSYDVIGVEAKKNGWLDKEEREKCKWLLDKKIFSRIFIAKKGKKRGETEYVNFKDKYAS
ncbi:MAG: hypothetical protein ABIH65_01795 [Nanoarchaeota archaeon]